ncbi:MAG TPA: YceI family protein [Steroidobacteraceae bacterium]|nr:YceI family protein [Steroidobacteraceae bacterium]
MIPRHTWLAGLIAVGAALLAHTAARASDYILDPQRTVISFELRSMGATQRGDFRRAAGAVMLDSTAGVGELDIVIDAGSLDARNGALTKFVRGPSMLNAAAHPQIAYKARRIVFAHGRPVRIEGELTMLGVTRPVPLEISSYACRGELTAAERCAIVATASVKRSEFGMTRYRLLASDDVQLAIHAEGVRPQEAGGGEEADPEILSPRRQDRQGRKGF